MPLITTSEQMAKHLPQPYGKLSAKLPDMSTAETQYLLPIIGPALYHSLLNDDLNSDGQALMELCRAVVAPFAYLSVLDFMAVQLSDNGLVVLEAENARKPFKWEYNQMKEALACLGYARQEALISYLEQKRAVFPSWADSDYQRSDFYYIRNGKELASVINILQPQRSFLALRPLMLDVAELTLKELLSEEYYSLLNERIKDNSLSELEDKLIKILRPMLAKLTMAKAATMMNVQYQPGVGFTLVAPSKDTIAEGKVNADATMMGILIKSLHSDAKALMQRATKLLNENATPDNELVAYYASEKYSSPDQKVYRLENNKSKRSFRC